MTDASRFWLIVLGLVSGLCGTPSNAEIRKEPSVDDFLSMKSFPIEVPLSLSSDGQWVAYTLQDGRRIGDNTDPESIDERPGSGRYTRGCEIWISNIRTGRQMRISEAGASSWAPSWSSDGQNLAFYSDVGGRARPWVWNRKNKLARPVAKVRPRFVRGYDAPAWTEDGMSILFRALPNEVSAIQVKSGPSVLVVDSPQELRPFSNSYTTPSSVVPGVADQFVGDLVQVSVATGQVRSLTHGQQIYGYLPSPGGRYVALTTPVGYEQGDTDWTLFDIIVKNLATGQSLVVADNVLLDNSGEAISWSPDGRELAYGTLVHGHGTRYWVWSEKQNFSHAIGDAPSLDYPLFPLWNAKGTGIYLPSHKAVYAFDLTGRESKTLRAAEPLNIIALFGSRQKRIAWSDDTERDSVYIAEQNPDTLDVEIHRLQLSGGTDDKILTLSSSLALIPMDMMEGTPDGEVLVFPLQSPSAPEDLWAVGAGFKNLRQLTHVNPQLDGYKFPERRVVRWVDFEGHPLRGTLVLPVDYREGQRYPLIIDLYGGEPNSHWGKQFSATFSDGIENMQLYATRGYAAFVPDTFMGTESPMLDLYKSLVPGIEKLVSMGIVDENAMGIIGHSYGGYSVYSVVVQTNRFKAGVALSGSGNLLSNYGEMDLSGFPRGIAWAEKSQGRMGDTPWKVRDKYVENSPFFYLDRVQTPLLIAHGGSDWHPAYEDREMFVGLRRLGKTSEYAEYYGGGHRLSGWQYVDQIDLANRVLGWFDRYLRAPAPRSAKDQSAACNTTRK